MRPRTLLALLAAIPATALLTGCTVTSIGSEDGPPRVESDGLIEGHAAFGIRDEHRFVRLQVLDGDSDGALAQFVLWKLFRLEVGALGVGVGIGPFDFALGTLFYDADVPRMIEKEKPPATVPPEDCELCREARAKIEAEEASAAPAAEEPPK
jgi:hypothetical protein